MKKKSIILLLFEVDKVASQRFRLENIASSLGDDYFDFYHVKKGFFNFLKSELKILTYLNYSKIIFNRWPNHYGFSPSLFVISFFTDVIFDFDDAIWTSENDTPLNYYKFIVFKLNSFLSKKILCGNKYLLSKVSRNKGVYIPTILNNKFFLFDHNQSPPEFFTFGWTGSKSTIKYLENIIPHFDKLYKSRQDFRLIYMTSIQSSLLDTKPYSRFIQWNKFNEIDFIDSISCGIMPLDNNNWENGKCGFKLLQYLSRGKIALADYTDVNSHILNNISNSDIVINNWFDSLNSVLTKNNLFFNKSNSNYVKDNFSIDSYKNELIDLFIHPSNKI